VTVSRTTPSRGWGNKTYYLFDLLYPRPCERKFTNTACLPKTERFLT